MRPGYKTKIIYYKYCPLLANLCKIIDFSERVNEQNFFSMEKDHQKFESQVSPQQIKLDMGNEEDSRQKLLLDFFFFSGSSKQLALCTQVRRPWKRSEFVEER